jgi:hypothetical protein
MRDPTDLPGFHSYLITWIYSLLTIHSILPFVLSLATGLGTLDGFIDDLNILERIQKAVRQI